MLLHLAQIFASPAYYDVPIDCLSEPYFSIGQQHSLGQLREILQVSQFLDATKVDYIKHITAKLTSIAQTSGERQADILIFPEYSIPVECLSVLHEKAVEYGIVIVGGSHRVHGGTSTESIREQLGIQRETHQVGSAYCPVFLPDGSIVMSGKSRQSKWEPNLTTVNSHSEVIHAKCGSGDIDFVVSLCIDCLALENFDRFSQGGTTPHLVVCPSMTPTTEHFNTIGEALLLHETLLAFVNVAQCGNTSVNFPESWSSYLRGPKHHLNHIPKGIEGVLEVEFSPDKMFEKRGSIVTAPNATHPFPFPVIYEREAKWIPELNNLEKDIGEWLECSEKEQAMEWVDSFLTDSASVLPELVTTNLKFMRHSLLPLYDGLPDAITKAATVFPISDSTENTQAFWSKSVNKGLRLLTDLIASSSQDKTTEILGCVAQLKSHQRELPTVTLESMPDSGPSLGLPDAPMSFAGEENLVEAFQDRGPELDQAKNYLTNRDVRVVVVTGPIGIGKSDFVNCLFRKTLPDWNLLRVSIPKGGNVPRLISQIAYVLGLPMDTDSLASATTNVFRQKIRKVLASFYAKPNRCLIVDDLFQLLTEGVSRNTAQLRILIEEAASPATYIGGRVLIVSSKWLPQDWLHRGGIAHLKLRKLHDRFTRRIIERQVRVERLIEGETSLNVTQALLDVVGGHPLSARLLVEALRGKDMDELTNGLPVAQLTTRVAQALLERVPITEKEEVALMKLSVFRLPILRQLLKSTKGFDVDERLLFSLANRCVLSFDGNLFEMHEAVRRYYYHQVISSGDAANEYHQVAASYYEELFEQQRLTGQADPAVKAELVHHLSVSGQVKTAKTLRLLVVEELKPTARIIYREYRNYEKALELYRLLQDLVPDDPVVSAYVGRCQARRNQWSDSDEAFEHAIRVANKVGQPVWWLYRDWGHIRARYGYYKEAMQRFDRAASSKPKDPSIKASIAYMKWQQGEIQEARDLFEEALSYNSHHVYTLSYYPAFLESIGEFKYATELRARLEEIAESEDYYSQGDYDGDVEDGERVYDDE